MGMRNLLAVLAAALMPFVIVGTAGGGSVRDQLHIQAIVPPMLEYRIVHEKRGLKITKSDVRRGYKDVDNGMIVSVTTNIPDGYIVSVTMQPLAGAGEREGGENDEDEGRGGEELREGDVYTYATVTVDGRSFGAAPGGTVDIQIPSASKAKDTVRLGFRFTLSPGARAGTYRWPVYVSVYPL